jgi:site-specific DNA recombinase
MSKRAAIYVRVSTDDQAKEQGPAVQLEACRALARARGWDVVAELDDNGTSGMRALAHRQGGAMLLGLVWSGQVDVVVVPALSRLGRSVPDIHRVIEEDLDAMGVDLATCDGDVDTTSTMGRAFMGMTAVFARLERDLIVGRTTDGRNERGRQDGERGGTVPYGYHRVPRSKPSQVEVVPDRAQAVRRIFALRAKGKTMQAIADALNADGAVGARGKGWHPNSVRRVLEHEATYRGGKRGTSEVRWPAILKKGGK